MLNPYYSYRDELSVYHGLIFRGERIVIPHALCYQTMKQMNSSHIGINGCLREPALPDLQPMAELRRN